MASWLNMADVVSLMLETSFGTVSVDAMDAHGATALMCKMLLSPKVLAHSRFLDAARDGNLDVVKTLVCQTSLPGFSH